MRERERERESVCVCVKVRKGKILCDKMEVRTVTLTLFTHKRLTAHVDAQKFKCNCECMRKKEKVTN